MSRVDDGFAERTVAQSKLLVYEPLWQQGIIHGFGGREQFDRDRLKGAFNLNHVLGVKQVHGDTVWDLRRRDNKGPDVSDAIWDENGTPPDGDAIIAYPADGKHLQRVAITVKTADCVPIILIGQNEVAVIHAGWRGLANGVTQKTLKLVSKPQMALIGPCARECCYEVGPEVLTSIGDPAEYEKRQDKFFLSTGGTAFKILTNYNALSPHPMEIIDSKLCTICDLRFNSFRRDKNKERNINFILAQG